MNDFIDIETKEPFLDTVVPYTVRDAFALRAMKKDVNELRADFNRWAIAGFAALVTGFGGVIATLILH